MPSQSPVTIIPWCSPATAEKAALQLEEALNGHSNEVSPQNKRKIPLCISSFKLETGKKIKFKSIVEKSERCFLIFEQCRAANTPLVVFLIDPTKGKNPSCKFEYNGNNEATNGSKK
jgi:hypothetical protein